MVLYICTTDLKVFISGRITESKSNTNATNDEDKWRYFMCITDNSYASRISPNSCNLGRILGGILHNVLKYLSHSWEQIPQVQDFLIPEDETDRLSRNVRTELPLYAA
jgi:hypothetical protein